MKQFGDYNPFALLLYFSCVAGIAMFCKNPILAVSSLFGALLLWFLENGTRYKRMHLFTFSLFLVLTLANPLFSHNGRTVLFFLNNNPVTWEAFIYGLVMSLMAAGVVYWFHSFSRMMTSDKVQYLFGLVSPKAALILSMALRYVPLFSLQMRKTQKTQKAMGLYKEENIIDRLRGGLSVFSIVTTWAIENGITTADSMAARGYGTGRRGRFALYAFTRRDAALAVSSLLLSGVTAAGIASGRLSVVFYPDIVLPSPHGTALLYYGCYLILCLLPAILEIKEKLQWRSLQSRNCPSAIPNARTMS